MAKNTDHRADRLVSDDTGGLLSGLLAEEEDLDRHALWRIGSWGVGAVAAVIIAVMANQTSLGWKRDQVAAVDLTRQAQQIQLVARENHAEARRLAAAIETLNTDRDRLYSRVSSLEQGLDSATGALARQTLAASRPPSPAAAEPQAAPVLAPAVAPVATTAAADKASAEPGPAAVSSIARDASKTDLPRNEIKKLELAKIETRPEITKSDMATPATPLVAAKSLMAPPDPSAAKLIEPARPPSPVTATPIPEVVASTAPDADPDEDSAPRVVLQRTQFGVDVGAASSVAGLRVLWRGLLKSKSGTALAPLRPIIMIREAGNGPGLQLRLVAGPLNDAGAAARICAVLTENDRKCETAIFEGQRLSMTAEDVTPASGAAKPGPRRRGAVRRAAALEEPTPKKPETSTPAISSWFGKKGQ